MKLVVGFLTYNDATAKYLGDFLPSLEAALSFLKPDDYRVYAFDNSDGADMANRQILSRYPEIEYFCQERNLGFARAYNVLIRKAVKADAEYFLVINPDTILESAAIKNLIEALDNDESLGSAAPKILRWDFAGRRKTDIIDSLGLVLRPGLKFIDRGQGLKDGGQKEPAILGPSGAAGLFRISALEKIAEIRIEGTEDDQPIRSKQYFDERFFMYKEDCDLVYRLFLAGFDSRSVPESVIYHDRTAAISGQSLKYFWRDRQSKSRQVRAWSFRNQHFIFLKHWKRQNLVNKIVVGSKMLFLLLFSLILEQFLLKEYPAVLGFSRRLTNIK